VNKKNQKNFINSLASPYTSAQPPTRPTKGPKVFCFFFPKKKRFPFQAIAHFTG